MNISGKRELNGPINAVWETLIDPDALRNSVPGISQFDLVGEDQWDAKITMGVAAIKGSYTVKISMSDKVIPTHYRLAMEGNGLPGWVKGGGAFDLSETEDNKTIIVYNLEAQVGGLVASVGQRLLGGVAKLIFKQFFDSMEKQLKARLVA